MMRRLLRPFLILLALVFLFEAWLWRHLAPIVGWVVAFIPWAAFKTRVAAAIEAAATLPDASGVSHPGDPAAAAQVVGFWMLAHGSLAGRAPGADACQDREPRRHRLHLRSDAAEAAGACPGSAGSTST